MLTIRIIAVIANNSTIDVVVAAAVAHVVVGTAKCMHVWL